MLATSLVLLASGAHTPENPAEAPALESSATWAELLAEPALPKQSGGGISYSFIEASYGSGDSDAESLALEGRFEVTDWAYLGAGFGSSEVDSGIDVQGTTTDIFLQQTTLAVGAGVHFEPTDQFSVFAELQFAQADFDANADGYASENLGDGDLAAITIGARFRPTEMIEGYVAYSDVDGDYEDNATGLTADIEYSTTTVGIRVYANESLAVNLDAMTQSVDDAPDADFVSVGVNYFF